MTHVIRITSEAMAAIRRHASPAFLQTATQDADGLWSVPLHDETYERLIENMQSGESVSDTIIRFITTAEGQIQ